MINLLKSILAKFQIHNPETELFFYNELGNLIYSIEAAERYFQALPVGDLLANSHEIPLSGMTVETAHLIVKSNVRLWDIQSKQMAPIAVESIQILTHRPPSDQSFYIPVGGLVLKRNEDANA